MTKYSQHQASCCRRNKAVDTEYQRPYSLQILSAQTAHLAIEQELLLLY